MAVMQNVECGVTPKANEAKLEIILRILQGISTEQGLQANTCPKVVIGLGLVRVPDNAKDYMQFISDIKEVQEILTKECSNNPDLIRVTLKAFTQEIIKANRYLSPAMSIVLQLIDIEYISRAVDIILSSGLSEQNLERALFTLCMWLTKWTLTDNLGPLVMCFMKGLAEQGRYSTLYNVSIRTIRNLFRLLVQPETRKNVGPIVFYMLSASRVRPKPFELIIPQINFVLSYLHKENTENSLIYLRQLVNISFDLVEQYPQFERIFENLKKDLEPFSSYCNNYIKSLSDPWDDSAIFEPMTPNTGKVGLKNLGNTCYMNSVLQALFMTKPFRNEMLLFNKSMMPLFANIQLLFALLQHSHRPSLSPTEILSLARPPGFLQGHQHDSSEFLGYLLDVLHEQEKNAFVVDALFKDGASSSFPQTVVQTAFGGRTASVSSCSKCKRKSERMDNFRELQLSFPNNSDDQSVQNLLDYYLQPEILCGDNQYHCDICDCLTDGERITRIEEAPLRLILTLKHFRYDPASQQRTKLLQSVKLDSHVQLEGADYELYAAVVHWGSSVDSGHYYTFAKDGGEWFKFNDCTVTRTTEDDLCSLKPPETPYILFYGKQDCIETEDLPCNVLSNGLQTAIITDNCEFESERKRQTIQSYNSMQHHRNDEPPSPGCGGGGFNPNSTNMYVC